MFGPKPSEVNDYIYDLFDTAPKLTMHQAQQLLTDVYETKFGIYDHIHTKNKHPFASILVKPSTDITQLDNVGGLIQYYFAKEVSKHIKLDEFLSLPHEYLQLVVAQIDKRVAKDNKAASDLDAAYRGKPKK